MDDLPPQGLLQQLHAKPLSGEHLEVLGKSAAASWCSGAEPSMNEAVISTVKHAGLSPEQVKRVVEFANTAAYLHEFRKEGSPHKVVDFGDAGPASPSAVLQELNSGGGGTVFDRGCMDYDTPPMEIGIKRASVDDETDLRRWFGPATVPEYPEVNPLGDAIALRDKLASVYETSTSELSRLEGQYADLRSELFHHVKQAALGGHTLSEVAEIWSRYAPDPEYVKVAFQTLYQPLVENGVFPGYADLADSLEKFASVGMVNPEHPLVRRFEDFCTVLSKLAEVRETQQVTGEGLAQMTDFLKVAVNTVATAGQAAGDAGGYLPKAWKAYGRFADAAGRHVGNFAEKALGKGRGRYVGGAARIGVKYVAPIAAANEAYRRTLKYNPRFNKAKNLALSMMPGTQEYYAVDAANAAKAYGGGY